MSAVEPRWVERCDPYGPRDPECGRCGELLDEGMDCCPNCDCEIDWHHDYESDREAYADHLRDMIREKDW